MVTDPASAALHEATWAKDCKTRDLALLRWDRLLFRDRWRDDVRAVHEALCGAPSMRGDGVLNQLMEHLDALDWLGKSRQSLVAARADWLNAQHCMEPSDHGMARVGRRLQAARVARGVALLLDRTEAKRAPR